ncbi:hypothetical protein IGX29_14295 [Streptomyces sp. H28]|uniref:hypothetical protein n=1 Tax=Streptomyces sp. H28 TaxID=2775865 RepID=UPI0017875EC6|nr:hypothetical protein [Streptomyces sp. H28]MBD9732956.1 hypothetical protein [Streptomyces sp. H28]
MKTFLFLLGLFLAAMACVAGRSAYRHGWDYIELGIAGLFLVGSIVVLRACGRMYDSPRPPA